MFFKASFFGFSSLLFSTSAFALTCLNDYSGPTGCANNVNAAGDCTTLGYSKDDVDGCKHYLYCPFDISYKRCVDSKKSCEDGYAQIVADCETAASSGSTPSIRPGFVDVTTGSTFHAEGWTLDLDDGDGTGCYKCIAKPCPEGFEAYSENYAPLCTRGSWLAINGYSGNSICKACQSCPEGYASAFESCEFEWQVRSSTTKHPDYPQCFKCVENSCSGFGLDSAPVHAEYEECLCGKDCSNYRIIKCHEGYELPSPSADDCVKIETCNFSLSACPENANCNECTTNSGVKKYQFISCPNNYQLKNNKCLNTCPGYDIPEERKDEYTEYASCSVGDGTTMYQYAGCSDGRILVDSITYVGHTGKNVCRYTLDIDKVGSGFKCRFNNGAAGSVNVNEWTFTIEGCETENNEPMKCDGQRYKCINGYYPSGRFTVDSVKRNGAECLSSPVSPLDDAESEGSILTGPCEGFALRGFG